tara:strand:+ start:3179 stop:3436 length:258 start_codon:yes stop_codon:yes gene_type:complete
MSEWKLKNRPVCLEKRFEFASYEDTRNFLDRLGDHSEKENKYPDISFGKTYVNITLRPEIDSPDAQMSQKDNDFAAAIDRLLQEV